MSKQCNRMTRRDSIKALSALSMGAALGSVEGIAGEDVGLKSGRKLIAEPARQIPVYAEADVVVAGAGPAGVAAALAAAETGARVVIVERHATPGGMTTAALMSCVGGLSDGEQVIIRGMAERIIKASYELQGLKCDLKQRWIGIDAEAMKQADVELLSQAGVKMLFHTRVADVIKEGNRVGGIIIENKSGRGAILAAITVDCTGDGDVFARAGAGFEKGDGEGLLMPMSLVFRISGVDNARLEEARKGDNQSFGLWGVGSSLQGFWRKGREAGKLAGIPLDGFMHLYSVRPGEYSVHATRVLKLDATRGEDLSMAEIEGRRQAWELFRYMKKAMPGCERAWISQTPQQIGVRESRRLKGCCQLTAGDVLGAKKFADAVARGCYLIDLHNTKGSGFDFRELKKGESYDVPYRCMVPEKIDNLLVAGRCISAAREAHGSTRIQAMCMATGHAAGTAAAMAAKEKVLPRSLDIPNLKNKLKEQNANLGT